MCTSRPTWMCLALFLVVVIVSCGVFGGSARADTDPTTFSVQRQASDKTRKALFTTSGRRGTLDWGNDPTVVRTRFVEVDPSLLSGLDGTTEAGFQSGTIVDLNLFDDVRLLAALERLDPLVSGGFTWVGRVENVDRSLVTFVVRNGIVMGNIALSGGMMYQVRYAGNGVHAVREIDQSMFPPEAEPIPVELRPGALDSGVRDPLAVGDDGSIIDVLVVYTPSARESAGGTAGMEALIELAVSETNSGYENSGINQRLSLVHTEEVSYTEAIADDGGMETDLDRVTEPSDNYMDEVHSLRDTYCADEVVLIVNSLQYCGIAWMMAYVSSSFKTHAFAVVSLYCATGYYSFGHELGHNMGANHDWFVSSATYPYMYSHGYVNTEDRWRTIMSYNNACSEVGGCTRIPHWSNPDVTYHEAPTGVPEGESSPADNRKTLNNTALTVANFRQSCSGSPPDQAVPISPSGTISQSNPTYSWSAVADSTQYYLYVSGPGGTVIETNYLAEEVCSGDTCSVTPATSLSAGAHIWKIQTRNPFGFGPWSSEMPFTVSLDGGGGGGGDPTINVLLILLDLLLGED